ncbi:hypothetical protein IFM61606_01358 [Aspergillus udagawae]|uniref:Glutamine amidotransferase type-2 domain-containing protein n=1 Tax=Aspergillus udagawae TaxID=91492 RepID=A0ABQ1AB37_9EURO|nr:hypothetical protein IFM53868_02206 [Aspergillus udagawae]GFG21502.1 hypothetical protein IFM61606_01358 [Aspergillus udagawae]
MCGIYFSLSTNGSVLPNEETCNLLRNRGPDSYQIHTRQQELSLSHKGQTKVTVTLTFISTVLSLRGDHVYAQPLVDSSTQSVLCWNGEAWKIAGEPIQDNDTESIFQSFLRATHSLLDAVDHEDPVRKIAGVISNITGPFSFVFYDAVNSRLYFSRDCLGRRSLLQGLDESGNLRICSVCDSSSSSHFEEVDTDGVHFIDFEQDVLQNALVSGAIKFNPDAIQTLRWEHKDATTSFLKSPISQMNKSIPNGTPPSLTIDSCPIQELERKLRQSLHLRIQKVPEPPSITISDVKVAVLFSGGLDCTLLARLSHDILPKNETIDLLNVAFENPRVAAAAAGKEGGTSSVYESCPDRITGRAAFAELQRVCPDRNWRFVAIDIPYTETVAHRDMVKRLMRPHNTEMDLSIACALYFASRARGTALNSQDSSCEQTQYTSPARVLLSGLGADELFAGYARHGVAFARNGFRGLIDEIHLDVSRLGKRNLGRDDRILSNWGREARYPFLDEDYVSYVLEAPVWEKCGFGVPDPSETTGVDYTGIDPEKKALRLLALKLGMATVAREKKRAIQFGSRTAKMEKGRTKGTDALS